LRAGRLETCPAETKIVYYKDELWLENYTHKGFEFQSFTFHPRCSEDGGM